MDFRYENANPQHGDESYVLKFDDPTTDTTKCLLVDAGEGIDLDTHLREDDEVMGVLLTHAHVDHFVNLSDLLPGDTPVYTSPGTANIMEDVLEEGQKHYATEAPGGLLSGDRGVDIQGDSPWDTDKVADQLNPVTDWTDLADNIRLRTVPVGHAPGATGFLIQFDDVSTTQTILVTGDFSFTSVAGYQGLAHPPVEIDAVFVNSVTTGRTSGTENTDTPLTDSIDTAIESARAGKRVLLTGSALTGVHYAYLLGHLAEEEDLAYDVRVTGQTAKLYTDLEYETPHVTTHPVWDSPDDVLARGTITIAGPETPREGGSGSLFDDIEDDPAATLIQVVNSGTPLDRGACTTYAYNYDVHPSEEEIESFLKEMAAESIVVQHGHYSPFQDEYSASFTWTIDRYDQEFTLYRNGFWTAPEWVQPHIERSIRGMNEAQTAHSDVVAEPSPEDYLTPRRDGVDFAAEGVDIDALSLYRRSPDAETDTVSAEEPKTPEQAPAPGSNKASADGAAHATDGGASAASTGHTGASSENPATAKSPESAGDTAEQPVSETTSAESDSDGEDLEDEVAAMRDQLDRIEATLNEQSDEPMVSATIVDAGDEMTLLRVDEDIDGDHGDTVTISVSDP